MFRYCMGWMLGIFLVGCSSQTPTPSLDSNQTALEEKSTSEIEPLNERIQEVYWKLIGIQGKAILTEENEREAYIILKLENQRLQGFGGCNILLGSYVLKEAQKEVHFMHVASTMMACPRMNDETAFLKTLEQINRYTIDNGVLIFLHDNEEKMSFAASFEP